MKKLPVTVYPSDTKTVSVNDDEIYGGAHHYEIMNCMGFEDGTTKYIETVQEIRFIQKDDDGEIMPGLQSEQVLVMLIDRHKKLNMRFPSREGALAITKMEESLHWLESRVKERMNRQVMGELKK